MNTNTKTVPVQRARVSYVGHLNRARRRGDYLRSIVPDAGVSVAGNVLYRGRIIGAYTIMSDALVDRRGNAVPIEDRDAIIRFFERAAIA